MKELASRNSKDSRIKLNKLNDYIELLSQQGTRAGEPYIKHLEAEIWELRPLRDRILFVAWIDGSFVFCIILLKRRKRLPDGRLRRPNESCKIWKKEG